MSAKKTVATVSLAGCFGCHMSLLDIDERLFDLLELVEFDRSPIDDLKQFTRPCDIGLIEGGCCNSENVEVLREFRKNCKVLVSIGECAIMGGLPSLRNGISVRECLEEAYLRSPSVKHNEQGVIPNDRALPILLDKVYPCQEVVKVDYHIPGCPPRADLIWEVLTALLQNREPKIPYEVFKYD
jgi:NAD-reducing hydrogenase small subunit